MRVSKIPPLMVNMIDHIPAVHYNIVYYEVELAGFLIYWDLDKLLLCTFYRCFSRNAGLANGTKI